MLSAGNKELSRSEVDSLIIRHNYAGQLDTMMMTSTWGPGRWCRHRAFNGLEDWTS